MAAVLGSIATTGAVRADRLSDYWQEQRDFYVDLSHRACAGNPIANDLLERYSWEKSNPVAMNNLAWLIRPGTDCAGRSHDRDEWLTLNRLSAEAGYPVSMHNWGYALVTGEYGPRDFESGLNYLEEAMDQGHAVSAETLAIFYAEGRHGISADIGAAYMFYDRAAALGLPRARLSKLDRRIEKAAEGAPGQGWN